MTPPPFLFTLTRFPAINLNRSFRSFFLSSSVHPIVDPASMADRRAASTSNNFDQSAEGVCGIIPFYRNLISRRLNWWSRIAFTLNHFRHYLTIFRIYKGFSYLMLLQTFNWLNFPSLKLTDKQNLNITFIRILVFFCILVIIIKKFL